MASLLQINNRLRLIAQEHQLIEMFFFGNPLDLIDNTDIKYPVFCFDVASSPMMEKVEQFPYQMWLLDLVDESLVSDEAIASDLLMIANDIIALLTNSNEQFVLSKTIQRDRIVAEGKDRHSGWVINATIYQPMNYNQCLLPLDTTPIIHNNFSKEFKK